MKDLLASQSADALLVETLIIILASVCAVALLARARLPAVLGYLVAGWAVGPHGLALMSASVQTRFLAELGVIFLMFMVGLEFSVPAINRARGDVLGGGTLQVGLTCLAIAGALVLLGASWPAAIVLGGAVAMSSTALALKQLADQGEVSSEHGRRALGVLLFQDLAALPFLVMVGAWQRSGQVSVIEILRELAIAAAVLVTAALCSRPVFRAVLFWVARVKSADLFLLSVLLLALGTAYGAHVAGLAPSIGAFLAGMVIGEGDFRHQVEDDVRPFRDLLLGLFFVTVGMEVNPSIIALAPWAVLVWIMVLVPGKALLAVLAGLCRRWPLPEAVRISVILAHGGEFGLLLLTQASAAGIIGADTAQPALLALVVTMGLAPVLIQHNGVIAKFILWWWLRSPPTADESTDSSSDTQSELVLICGYGRVGRLVATVLEQAQVAFIVLEWDVVCFRQARDNGHRVVFGDASRKHILQAAGLERARLLVITFDRQPAVGKILHHAHEIRPDLRSIVSAADDRTVSSLALTDSAAVFPENLAAGLALADQALLLSGFAQEEAARVITDVRLRLNPELRGHVGI